MFLIKLLCYWSVRSLCGDAARTGKSKGRKQSTEPGSPADIVLAGADASVKKSASDDAVHAQSIATPLEEPQQTSDPIETDDMPPVAAAAAVMNEQQEPQLTQFVDNRPSKATPAPIIIASSPAGESVGVVAASPPSGGGQLRRAQSITITSHGPGVLHDHTPSMQSGAVIAGAVVVADQQQQQQQQSLFSPSQLPTPVVKRNTRQYEQVE